jgi:hypothetical protein
VELLRVDIKRRLLGRGRHDFRRRLALLNGRVRLWWRRHGLRDRGPHRVVHGRLGIWDMRTADLLLAHPSGLWGWRLLLLHRRVWRHLDLAGKGRNLPGDLWRRSRVSFTFDRNSRHPWRTSRSHPAGYRLLMHRVTVLARGGGGCHSGSLRRRDSVGLRHGWIWLCEIHLLGDLARS